ncbi:hypothetical protein ACH4SK_08450 [Streptomyces inhibens]|uniref:hypothetical protein n=1 Tax=Streptomyces inhibens TaxID=2293571 RepID=UPI0037B8DA00
MNSDDPSLRRLPWAGEGSRPCYLSTDGTGPVSRLVNRIEAVQLGLAGRLLGHAQGVLADLGQCTASELGFLAAQLADALHDALFVAESRGSRLALADGSDDADDDEHV